VRERKQREFDPTSEMLRELIAEPGFDDESPDTQDRVHETLRLMESLGIWTDEMLRLSPSTLDKLLRLGASVQRFVRSEAADTRAKRGRRA
jgi:DNA-binding transcriptional regulator GbsR (MarR family)